MSENLKPCVRILNLLKNNKTSWPFREPVDPIALGIPHYTEIIKEPMDLSTVENNLRTNQYVSPTQFHADVSKIITNSYTFNSSDIHFTKATAEFEAYYRKITAEPGSDYNRSYSQHDMAADYSKSSALEMKKSRKQIEQDNSSAPIITMAEKKELGLNIKKLPKEDMKGILDIVKEGTGKIIGEFDLKELDPSIIRKLQTYVKEKMNGDSKIKGMNNDKRNNDNDEESSFEVGEEDDESWSADFSSRHFFIQLLIHHSLSNKFIVFSFSSMATFRHTSGPKCFGTSPKSTCSIIENPFLMEEIKISQVQGATLLFD